MVGWFHGGKKLAGGLGNGLEVGEQGAAKRAAPDVRVGGDVFSSADSVCQLRLEFSATERIA
jgi:hypothetical protein